MISVENVFFLLVVLLPRCAGAHCIESLQTVLFYKIGSLKREFIGLCFLFWLVCN